MPTWLFLDRQGIGLSRKYSNWVVVLSAGWVVQQEGLGAFRFFFKHNRVAEHEKKRLNMHRCICVLRFQILFLFNNNNNNQPTSFTQRSHARAITARSPRARVELRVEFRVVLRATHATHQTTQHGVCRQLHRRCCRRRKQWTGADRCGTWLQPQPHGQWGASLCFFAFLGSTGALSQPILLHSARVTEQSSVTCWRPGVSTYTVLPVEIACCPRVS